MSLDANTISMIDVKNALGETSDTLLGLSVSSLINKWSRWKPIQYTGDVVTDAILVANNFGILIPRLFETSGSTFNLSTWTYIKPTVKCRLGDFRNYEHVTVLPMRQNYGTLAMSFNRFKGNTGFIQFQINAPLSGDLNTSLYIQNLKTESGQILYGNVYLGLDVYHANNVNGNPVLSLYSKKTISYSTLRTDLTGDTVLDADKYTIDLTKLINLPGDDYKLHLYLSTARTSDGTTAWLTSGVEIYPILWDNDYPQRLDARIDSLQTSFTTKFTGILPYSGTWADGSTDYRTGYVSPSKVGTIRTYKVKIDIVNDTDDTLTISKDNLRVLYNKTDWNGTITQAYATCGTGSLVIGAGLSATITSDVMNIFPSSLPGSSVDISIIPNPELKYYNNMAQIGYEYENFTIDPLNPIATLEIVM